VSDQAGGVRRAVEHLRDLGHEQVTYLAGPEASWADGIRWRAAAEAAALGGMRIRRVGPCEPTVRGGLRAISEFAVAPTSSVIAYNDLLAVGFMRGFSASGGSVPEDVSVVGFDDILEADLVSPGLTTVAAPLHDMGASAVRAVVHAFDHREASVLRPAPLPTSLVCRGSTGQPSR
jgi:LacI family transcriptional regulator